MLRHPLARSDNISNVTATVADCCSGNTEKSNHSFPVVSSFWKTKKLNKRLLRNYRRQEWSKSVAAFNYNLGGKRWWIYGVIIIHLNVSVRASNEWMLCQQAVFFCRRWWAAGVYEEGNRRRKNKADRINGFDFNLVELLKSKGFVHTGWQEPK